MILFITNVFCFAFLMDQSMTVFIITLFCFRWCFEYSPSETKCVSWFSIYFMSQDGIILSHNQDIQNMQYFYHLPVSSLIGFSYHVRLGGEYSRLAQLCGGFIYRKMYLHSDPNILLSCQPNLLPVFQIFLEDLLIEDLFLKV